MINATVLYYRQDPLNTMNMENICTYLGGLSTPICILKHDWDDTLVNK